MHSVPFVDMMGPDSLPYWDRFLPRGCSRPINKVTLSNVSQWTIAHTVPGPRVGSGCTAVTIIPSSETLLLAVRYIKDVTVTLGQGVKKKFLLFAYLEHTSCSACSPGLFACVVIFPFQPLIIEASISPNPLPVVLVNTNATCVELLLLLLLPLLLLLLLPLLILQLLLLLLPLLLPLLLLLLLLLLLQLLL